MEIERANFDYYDSTYSTAGQQPKRILVPTPPIGNKIACLRELGTFVLEEGPTLFRAMACTHGGSGGMIVYDGVPDENGFFRQTKEWRDADDNDQERLRELTDAEQEERFIITQRRLERWFRRNGRELTYANPAVMGMWMFDGGCVHGLTVQCLAEHGSVAPVLTITWQAQKKR